MTMKFPEISTVTYLTERGAPTLIFNQTTPDGNGEVTTYPLLLLAPVLPLPRAPSNLWTQTRSEIIGCTLSQQWFAPRSLSFQRQVSSPTPSRTVIFSSAATCSTAYQV